MSVYSDIKHANDEEEERYLRDLAKHEEDDFWDWWDKLDDIEREEYNRLHEEG